MERKATLMTLVISASFCVTFVLPETFTMDDRPKTIMMVPLFHPNTVRQMAYTAQELCNRGHRIVLVLNKLHLNIVPGNLCANHFTVVEYEYSKENKDAIASQYAKIIGSTFDVEDGFKDLTNMNFAVSTGHDILMTHCKDLLQTQNILERANALKPDLFVVDGALFPPCLLLIPFNLSIPFVMISGIQLSTTLGLPWLPSTSPNLMWTFTDDMSFSERVQNLLIELWVTYKYTMKDDHFLSTYAPGMRNYHQLFSQASLAIIARDHHLEFQEASMPYTLMLPGLTITSKEVKPLPAEITEFLGSSKFVVVSFGSVVNRFPKHITETLMAAFEEFPSLKFVCYLQQKEVKLPKNVGGYPWLPQVDLLSHPNAKLFIHHCGNSGQYEAAHQGVPMIGFPLFLPEQDHNCRRVEVKGLSKTLHVQNVTKTELVDTIKFVL